MVNSDCVDLRFIRINFVLFYLCSVFKRFGAQSFTNQNGEGRQDSMEGKLFPEDYCKFEVVNSPVNDFWLCWVSHRLSKITNSVIMWLPKMTNIKVYGPWKASWKKKLLELMGTNPFDWRSWCYKSTPNWVCVLRGPVVVCSVSLLWASMLLKFLFKTAFWIEWFCR